MFILYLAVTTVSLGLIYSNDLCYDILHHNCPASTDLEEIYQDQNGKLHRNFCEYTKYKCRYPSTEISSTFTCKMTALPTQLIHLTTLEFSTQPIHCNSMVCNNLKDVVCGSNGVTYNNKCLFEKAKCDYSDLYIQAEGACRNQ